jgi:long-chain fatty acid transport protein
MKTSSGVVGIVVAAGLWSASGAAEATNGYFAIGYGTKARGIAGVGVALPQDSLAAANNPAGIAFIGNRFDLGAEIFLPRREATIQGNAAGPDATYDGNGKGTFVIPEIGWNRSLRPDLAVGIAVFGNGGLNTEYASNPYARFGSTGTAGVDLAQLFISPAIAWKPTENQSIGLALNVAYQRFKATGLSAFAPFSSSPGNLTDRGYDSSWGIGVRLGWTARVNEFITLGATWQSKTSMQKFDKYQGLFADQGDFDIPQTWAVGAALRIRPSFTVAADVQRIYYSQVNSVGDPLQPLLQGVPLGASGGPGFGWRDITVFKVGTLYEPRDDVVLRAGVSFAQQPIPASQTLFNILAPGVVQTHLTLGATWSIDKVNEVTFSYGHAFSKTVNGNGSIPPNFGGGEANIQLQENMIGIAYGRKL